MIAGQTIPLELDFSDSDVDFTQATDIVATITYKDIKQDYTPTVVDATTLNIEMTQEQSLLFAVAPYDIYAKIQVNAMIDGKRTPSDTTQFLVAEQLHKAVIE